LKFWGKFSSGILILSIASYLASLYIPKVLQPVDFFTNAIIGAVISVLIGIMLFIKKRGKKKKRYGWV
jgi:hypothetical protein